MMSIAERRLVVHQGATMVLEGRLDVSERVQEAPSDEGLAIVTTELSLASLKTAEKGARC
jgi:hypothetical protein